MSKWAIIDANGTVLNVIIADNQEIASSIAGAHSVVAVDENHSASGYVYVNEKWVPIKNPEIKE